MAKQIKICYPISIFKEMLYMKKQKVLTLKVLLLFVLFSVGIIAFKPSAAYADSQTINTNGKTFIVVSDYNSGTTLYQKVSGYYKQVARTSKFGRYIFSYGKKLYFSGGGEGRPCYTFTYTIGKTGFKFEKKVYLKDHRGKYAIGYLDVAGDPSPSSMCCYNLSTKKVTKLGRGCDIHFIGNKIYYAYACNQYSSRQTAMQVIRRNANGHGKKVIKTIRIKQGTSYMYVLSAHKVKYFSNSNWRILKI